MTPEAMHMVMWQMSDRTIPRSMRMMQGFGVHSFRLVNTAGESTFVKFHWVPKLGLQSVVWDEAVKINGADPDFHRRDLYEAIEAGDYPEWDLCVQLFSEVDAEKLDFDHLDSTKLIPEEIIPLEVIGTLTLNKNPANVFDETEQVAFCTQNLVPGIDFSDDPLLHGRNFSYLDTQLSRLGSTNFHQIPINAPKCPFANMQRDGHMQTKVHPQRVTYTPSLLDPSGPREDREKGFVSHPTPMSGNKQRERSSTFGDHYSQARQFFLSQTDTEQNHIISALIFELSKVDSDLVRSTMLGHLLVIDDALATRVANGLGHKDEIIAASPAMPLKTDLPEAPSLSLLARAMPTLKGRMIGILVGDGSDADVFTDLVEDILNAEADYRIVCSKIGGVTFSDGSACPADKQLMGGPSVLFDAVAIVASDMTTQAWLNEAAAIAWVQDAFAHLKVIAATPEAQPLLDRAGVVEDAGIVKLDASSASFAATAAKGRIWAREPLVRVVF